MLEHLAVVQSHVLIRIMSLDHALNGTLWILWRLTIKLAELEN